MPLLYAERKTMYYYAMLDNSNIVSTTLQSSNPITAANMIPISQKCIIDDSYETKLISEV